MRILFVCTGNTCRSPMAEALLKDKLPDNEVQSAGIYANAGGDINHKALLALKEQNISSNSLSQPVTKELIEWANIILTMTEGHKDTLINQYNTQKIKCFTLKEFVLDTIEESGISDPFGQDLHVYQDTLEELDYYVSLLAKKIN